MAKLTKAQQHIVDSMKNGETLQLAQFTRAPSVWTLVSRTNSGLATWKTVNPRSVDRLHKLGLIVYKKDFSHYPYRYWYELASGIAGDGE